MLSLFSILSYLVSKINLLFKVLIVCTCFETLYFQSSSRFTAKLKGRYRDFPYTGYCPPHAEPPLLSTSLTDFTKDEPTLTHHNHPKTMVYLKFHSWCCTFSEFGQMCNDIYLSLYYTECLHCPKNSLYSAYSSFSSPPPREPLIFLLSPQFGLFQDVIQLESYSMQPLRLAFFTQ